MALSQVFDSSLAYLQQMTALQYTLISVNITLLFLAKPLFRVILKGAQVSEEKLFSGRAFSVFQRANGISLICVVLYSVILPLNQKFGFTKALSVLMIISCANLFQSLVNIFLLQRFGRKRKIDGEEVHVETYRSRLLSLMITAMTWVISLLLIVQVIGVESILETGGVIGFIGVMLALTQGAWAPDIISGLIILNTQILEEGDVIEIHTSRRVTGVVFKTKLFHTELLDLTTNHRVMIPNSQLRQSALLNLSKFASAKGLREKLSFKIGYDVRQSEVRKMFDEVLEIAKQDTDIPINELHDFEVRVLDAGDYAIEWGVFYYLKDVRSIFSTRHHLTALIAKKAAELDISLATPILHQSVDSTSPSMYESTHESQ